MVYIDKDLVALTKSDIGNDSLSQTFGKNVVFTSFVDSCGIVRRADGSIQTGT